MGKNVVVTTCSNKLEAELTKATLEAAGIACYLKVDDVAMMFPNMDFTSGIKLLVDEESLEEARMVLSSGAAPDANP